GYHCQVRKRLEGVFIEDLDSFNGTYVNRQRLTNSAKADDREGFPQGPRQGHQSVWVNAKIVALWNFSPARRIVLGNCGMFTELGWCCVSKQMALPLAV